MKNTVKQQFDYSGHIPAHDIEAENSILGICIFDGSEQFVKAKHYLKTPEAFYDMDNRKIWEAMNKLYDEGSPIDATLLYRELRTGEHTMTGNDWGYEITKKVDMNVTRVHMSHWCTAVVKDYVTRLSKAAVFDLAGNNDALEIAKELDEKVKKALDFTIVDDWSDMSQIALRLSDRRERIANGEVFGVMTGFKELDLLTGGLEPGFVVIAARPSMGKTAFACSLAINMAKLGSTVGIISLEMPNVQLAGRFASIVSGVEFWRIYRNQPISEGQQTIVNSGLSRMSTLPVYTTDNAKVTISDIRWKAEKLVKTKGAKCIIVDYIQLVNTEGGKANESREREVSKLSSGLKALSTDLGIVVIGLAQLNRESETPDKVSRPGKLSQLRESDSILADADMGIIVDRPFKRGEVTDENGAGTENKASIIIEKFRNGETKKIDLHFDPTAMHFRDEANQYPVSQFDTKITRTGSVPFINPFTNDEPTF